MNWIIYLYVYISILSWVGDRTDWAGRADWQETSESSHQDTRTTAAFFRSHLISLSRMRVVIFLLFSLISSFWYLISIETKAEEEEECMQEQRRESERLVFCILGRVGGPASGRAGRQAGRRLPGGPFLDRYYLFSSHFEYRDEPYFSFETSWLWVFCSNRSGGLSQIFEI